MKLSYNWLQTYFEKKIPTARELSDLFTFHSFEIEGLEEIKDQNGKTSDWMIDAKILPDRAHYCLSHNGIATEISVLTKLAIKNRYVDTVAPSIQAKPGIDVRDSKFCRRYTARTVENISITESPAWLKANLETIGQRSINSIVDLANYVMFDIGQPLHAFDADKIQGNIIVRQATDGEKIVLLDGREITLTAKDYVIADEAGPLVIAGAKGGKRAEVSVSTKRIILESANFDPATVRKTATKYDIRSDASKRFENEITPELAIFGMNNISALIAENCPEAKFGPVVDVYPNKAVQTVFDFDPSFIKERLGIEVPEDETIRILTCLGIGVSKVGPWTWTIPFERLDLTTREDIVEEVGRIYGYDHIQGILPPKTGLAAKVLPIFYYSEKIKNVLTSAGFSELSLYTLVENGEVETAKPLARDKAFARTNLSDGMVESLKKNVLNADLLGLEAIKVFGIGHVFKSDSEYVHLVIGASQVKKVKGLKSVNHVEKVLQTLLTELGIQNLDKFVVAKVDKDNHSVVEYNLSAMIESGLLPKVESYAGLEVGTISSNHYTKFSVYPFIVRDIAVFVPESVDASTVWSAIEKGIKEVSANQLLVRQALFDTFKKDGKVSYAFRMIFQSMDRTLTDDEVAKIMQAVSAEMKTNNWEVR